MEFQYSTIPKTPIQFYNRNSVGSTMCKERRSAPDEMTPLLEKNLAQ
jgi:hypothetical protein